MVVVLKKGITEEQKLAIRQFLVSQQFKINEINGEEDTVIAAVGRAHVEKEALFSYPGVETVIPISKPYKLASREFKKEDTVVEIPNSRGQMIRIGGQRLVAIAGPVAVESREQILEIASNVASSGAVLLRGGVYRPYLSPYSYPGLGEEGLKYLKEAGEKFGLPVVTEVVSSDLIPLINEYVDVFQIGAQNMQNFELLKKVGALGKPVILKRSATATLEELLMSAECLLASGTDKVILCERGIRTFETSTHNTLDLSAVPVLKSLTHLPVIVDPNHTVKHREQVPCLALSAVAAGADGILVQVHSEKEKGFSDGACSLLPQQFNKLLHDIEALAPVMAKSVAHIREEKKSVVENVAAQNSGKVICAFNGSKGAYADQAIGRYFDSSNVETLAVNSFGELFKAVVDGKADYGMVPIENSLAGSVYQNYDNFSRFQDVSIVGAVTLNIRHSLLVQKDAELSDIKNVYSHPQALSQCKKFLDAQNGWQQIDAVSTATAAEYVASQGKKENAAIGSTVNAELYGLKVLQEDIEDNPGNFTRFVVIQANHVVEKNKAHELNIKPNTASFIFTTKNQPGALHTVLGIFEKLNLNLTRLESRPILGQPWRYWFYIDIDIPEASVSVEKIMDELREQTENVRLLGMYSEAKN